MMRVPYIQLKQRSEVFYFVKFNALDLLKHLSFHFREPYSEYKDQNHSVKDQAYIETIKRKGIELSSSEEGIQRRLQINRIRSVQQYIESNELNFLPTSVLLSADISSLEGFEEKYLDYESEQIGYFEFPDNFLFSIIDGQHRLAGLSLVEESLLQQFEIPTILLFNVSKATAAKLFADINGKQKAVNKSLIYDLYSDIGDDVYEDIHRYHVLCENFYINKQSPLYRQIKMLGVGSGAISQAFFIDYVKSAISKTDLDYIEKTQEIFNHLFKYFKAYQETFPDDWPVPLSFTTIEQLEKHANNVLKIRKSQLVKTNGFGAILRAFPYIYNLIKTSNYTYKEVVSFLRNRINWQQSNITGTGKAFQNYLYNEIIQVIEDRA